jgi:hypothetical protein
MGNVRNFVYDLSTEKNASLNLRRTNYEGSPDVSVIDFKYTGFEYNSYKFPQLNFGYNAEDKFLVGLGFTIKRHGFRKEPYGSSQKLTTLYAPWHDAYKLKYEGTFNRVFFKNDIILIAEMANPTLNNFFGYGNSTEENPDTPRSYYRVRYKFVETDLQIRKRMGDILSFSFGPTYYHYWSNYGNNRFRILGEPGKIGMDSSSIYSQKDYLGGKVRMDINYVNSETFPTRGLTWHTDYTYVDGLNSNSRSFSKLTSDMVVYARVSDQSRLMGVFRFGGGHILSRHYEYFQALNLGANNFLRGFRKNRFSGTTLAYGSTELRLRLFTSKSYLLPGDVGLLGFFDIGRVWTGNDGSKKWHNAYGGGIYYVPFNLLMVSAAVAISEEDQLFNFSLGTKFNITF